MAVQPPRRWHALRGEAVRQALASPVRARSPHFVLHCAAGGSVVPDLRTEVAPEADRSVDNDPACGSTGLGFVVPKRWARRAVTRNLIRRQMREAARRHEQRIVIGASVLLRQRAALDGARLRSAASAAMREAVRAELDLLFSQLPDTTR
jgi:ribonuclease P protein component